MGAVIGSYDFVPHAKGKATSHQNSGIPTPRPRLSMSTTYASDKRVDPLPWTGTETVRICASIMSLEQTIQRVCSRRAKVQILMECGFALHKWLDILLTNHSLPSYKNMVMIGWNIPVPDSTIYS